MFVLHKVKHYQRKIQKYAEHSEVVIDCIYKLYNLPVTVMHLEKTGIGKTINALRKNDGDVATLAKLLVWKWKRMVADTETHVTSPAANSSCENVLSSGGAVKEGEATSIEDIEQTLSRTPETDNISEVLQDSCEQKCASAPVNQNLHVSKYQNDHCDNSHSSAEKGRSSHLSTQRASRSPPLNQISLKHPKEAHARHHHHRLHRNLRSKPQGEKEVKEERSIEAKKGSTKHRNEQKQKCENSGYSSKSKQNSKYARQKQKICRSEESSKRSAKQSKSSDKAKKMKIVITDDNTGHFAQALAMGDTMKKSNTCKTKVTVNLSTERSTNNTRKADPAMLSNVNPKPLEIDVDIASAFPETSIFKSLPRSPTATEDIIPQQQKYKTKVYSGIKLRRPVQTLHNLCLHVLKENIGALEYTGGVPYYVLKPILQHATPEQLVQIEYYNPYLIQDTDELWNFHCQKDFRGRQRPPMESSRAMYLRCFEERETKLKALTLNIQQSSTNLPRQIELAYIDCDVKPPPNIARLQGINGTRSSTTVSKSPTVTLPIPKTKPRTAPLMRKTLKLMKTLPR